MKNFSLFIALTGILFTPSLAFGQAAISLSSGGGGRSHRADHTNNMRTFVNGLERCCGAEIKLFEPRNNAIIFFAEKASLCQSCSAKSYFKGQLETAKTLKGVVDRRESYVAYNGPPLPGDELPLRALFIAKFSGSKGDPKVSVALASREDFNKAGYVAPRKGDKAGSLVFDARRAFAREFGVSTEDVDSIPLHVKLTERGERPLNSIRGDSVDRWRRWALKTSRMKLDKEERPAEYKRALRAAKADPLTCVVSKKVGCGWFDGEECREIHYLETTRVQLVGGTTPTTPTTPTAPQKSQSDGDVDWWWLLGIVGIGALLLMLTLRRFIANIRGHLDGTDEEGERPGLWGSVALFLLSAVVMGFLYFHWSPTIAILAVTAILLGMTYASSRLAPEEEPL